MDNSTFLGIIIGVVSALAAIGAAIVSWQAARQSEKAGASQQKLATHAAASDWLRDLREWASEGIDVLAEASYTCKHADMGRADCADQLRGCQHRISALIDRGRFFLPNQHTEKVGRHKPTAYQGWRHAALDPLVAAERVVSGEVGSGSYPNREAALIEMRRAFVSGIQRILAPDLHNKEIARMIREGNEYRASDETLGGLLPSDKAVPTGAERLLNAPNKSVGTPSTGVSRH
jgi:hypothetical protein